MYIGSKNSNSTTGIISKELIKKIEEPGNLKTKVFYYSGADSYIEECRGCTQCFISGKCALDQQDDMKYIRQKMLEADCIILVRNKKKTNRKEKKNERFIKDQRSST